MTALPYAAVVKVGGSLDGPGLPVLCQALAQLSRRHPLLVVPGGGRFADAVRDATHRYALDESTAHWMAILGMEQYGYLLTDLIPAAVAVDSLPAAAAAARGGATPVLLPFALLRRTNPLPHSWDVTSDSIAAWLCGQVAAARLVLLKDVPGIYARDPRHGNPGPILPRVTLDDPPTVGGIDRYLGRLLPALTAEVWVLSGTDPESVAALLEQHPGYPLSAGTRLMPP